MRHLAARVLSLALLLPPVSVASFASCSSDDETETIVNNNNGGNDNKDDENNNSGGDNGKDDEPSLFSGIDEELKAQNTPDGWTAVSLPQLPSITSANTFYITDFGAVADAADNTAAIQKALDAVPGEGGMVVIPAGTWIFGSKQTSTTDVLGIKSEQMQKLNCGA